MAGFLYFLPRSEPSAPSLDAIAAAGLGYAFDTQPEAVTCRMNSPCGLGPGFVLGDQSRMGDYSVKYAPAEQEWRKLPCGCAVGWYRDAPPGPDDLAKGTRLNGYSWPMNDGQEWVIPIVRNVDEVSGDPHCALPAVLTIDDEGNIGRGGPVARYRELWNATGWAWEAMLAQVDIEHQRAAETAGVVIGANYYVSHVELIHLGVFSDDLSPELVLTLCNQGHVYERWRAAVEESTLKNSSCQVETPGEHTSVGDVA